MNPKQTLILLRHAHREVFDRRQDNGLSQKGLNQALALQTKLGQHLQSFGTSFELFSSPKKRCVETISSLCQVLGQEVKINPKLDERSQDEDSQAFEERIQSLGNELIQNTQFAVACSHGDILPELIFHFTELRCDLGKSGWVELRRTEEAWVIENLVRSVDDLH